MRNKRKKLKDVTKLQTSVNMDQFVWLSGETSTCYVSCITSGSLSCLLDVDEALHTLRNAVWLKTGSLKSFSGL